MANQTATREARDQRQAEQPGPAPQGNLPAESKKQHPLVAFQAYATERAEQLNFALPAHMSPERFTRVLMTALQRKPDLLKCTKQSLWNACMLAAQDGLLPDGREGAIVPYGENADGKKQADIATWMPMIEGLRKKARNSGEIADWTVQVVRARDHFRFALGDQAFIEHEPYFGGDDPGPVIGAYSIATMKDGTKSREVMSKRDLDAIKAKSKAKNGPWSDPTFVPEMYRKTVARRHYKQLPHSSDLDDMIARDDQAFGIEDRSDAQIEQRQTRRISSVNQAFDQFAGTAPIEQADEEVHDTETGEIDPPAEEQQSEPPQDRKDQPQERQTRQRAKPAEEPKRETKQERRADPPQEQQSGPDAGDAGDGDDAADHGNDATDGAAGLNDPGVDTDAEWPLEDKPTNAAEYALYVKAQIRQATDPRALQNAFVEDGSLRKECGVSQSAYSAFMADVKARMEELRRARS